MEEKMELVEKLNIQPPASIYGTFARYSYKMWYAIAEFVDNSTASFYKNERTLKFIHQDKLLVDIEYNPDENWLKITDNAFGMEIDDFKRAILLNSRPDNNDGRNEFGMGLKTAASWFGKIWSVTSTKYGSNKKYYATVNIPELDKTGSNEIDINSSICSTEEHGTVIEIRELTKRIDSPRTIAKIKDIIRSMYRRDLASGKITIKWRGESLHFKPYQILTHNDKEWRMNVDYYFDFNGINHHVIGFVGILGGDDSGYKKAGFALFRRGRVVIGSEGEYYKPLKIFVEAQSKISHKLFGELDLDDFQINQAKDGFVWDDGLEEAFLESLKVQIRDYIKFANKTINERENSFDPKDKKEREKTKNETQSSLNNLFDSNNNPVLVNPSESKKTDEEIEFENSFVNGPELPELLYKETTEEYDIPIGRNIEKIKVTWSDAGSAYWFDYNNEVNEIKINIAHPFFKPFCSSSDFKTVLNKFVIAIVLAEKNACVNSEQDGYAYVDDINNEINKILKGLAK